MSKTTGEFPRFSPANSMYLLENEMAGKRNHRIIGWKRPLRSSNPTIHPTPPFLLNHLLKCHIYTSFKCLNKKGKERTPQAVTTDLSGLKANGRNSQELCVSDSAQISALPESLFSEKCQGR